MLGLLVKSIFLVTIAILFRSCLPRYRVDQLLSLNWKLLIYYLIFIFMYIVCLTLVFL
jgi:NADH:ubiquinone oxidoreductase subunit H